MDKKVLPWLIEERSSHSDDIAVVSEKGSITYKEMSLLSNRIGSLLQSHNVKKGAVVGLYMGRGINYVVSMLGVSKGGYVFLPLDKSYPTGRLQYMLNESRPEVLIAELVNEAEGLLSGLDEDLRKGIRLLVQVAGCGELVSHELCGAADQSVKMKDRCPTGLPPISGTIYRDVEGEDSKYILYTSGSTGKPKGIEGVHKSLSHFIHWECSTFSIGAGDRVSHFTPVSFDVSLRDIYVPSLGGGRLCIPSEELRMDARKSLEWIGAQGITVIHVVPSIFRLWYNALDQSPELCKGLSGLRYIFLAGEPLYWKDVARWHELMGKGVQLVNLYGPTETTLAKLYYPIEWGGGDDREMVPLGKPISNTVVLILKDNILCASGQVGEICIKTPFRSKGYYKDKDLTNRKFIQNPLHDDYEDIIYRTGDMGRYREDGSVQFLGRQDDQVKINGNRVEIQEIESLLRHQPEFDQVIVHCMPDDSGELILASYYISSQAVDEESICDRLKEQLPSYMIPGYFVRLETFPLNINGKIDRHKLPRPQLLELKNYQPPATELEQTLANIWSEVLGRNKIGVNDSFFDMGGSSLKVLQIISKLYKETKIRAKVGDIFMYPTIKSFAKNFNQVTLSPSPTLMAIEDQSFYPVSDTQNRFWIADKIDSNSGTFNVIASYHLKGLLNVKAFVKTIDLLCNRHSSLRTVFPMFQYRPRQKIIDPEFFKPDIQYLDLSNFSDGLTVVQSKLNQESLEKLDVERGPLFKVKLFKLKETEYVAAFIFHHVLVDAWSLEVFAHEFCVIYFSECKNGKHNLPPLIIQYKDYTVWEAELLNNLESSRSYWIRHLNGQVVPLHFKGIDALAKGYKPNSSSAISTALTEKITNDLRQYSSSYNVSLFTLILSCIKILIHTFTQKNFIYIGCPVTRRNHEYLTNQIGSFLNLIVLKTEISPDDRISDIVERIRVFVIEGLKHQEYPYYKLVKDLGLHELGGGELFQVGLTWYDKPGIEPAGNLDLEIVPIQPDIKPAKTDLWFHFHDGRREIQYSFEYNNEMFTTEYIDNMLSTFQSILENLLYKPEATIKDVLMEETASNP